MHLGYEIAEPVTMTEMGRPAPIRFAAALEDAYRLALDADPAA